MSVPRQPAPEGSEPARALTLAHLAAHLVLVIGVGLALVYNVWNLDERACLGVESRVPGWRFVLVGILGLLVGRYSGALRYLGEWRDTAMEQRRDESIPVGRIALAVIFFGLILTFLYEAVGVYQPPNGLEPITYYVRCAIWIDEEFGGGVRTMLIIFFISFLFGQYLWAWYPRTEQYRGQMRSALRELAGRLASTERSGLPRPRLHEPPLAREGEATDAANRSGS
jgi:hypothetical protein